VGGADQAGADPALVGEREAAAPVVAGTGEERRATAVRAGGRPTGKAAVGSDFVAETGPNPTGRSATLATGIAAAAARPRVLHDRGTATTVQARAAAGRGSRADGRPTEVSTARGASKGPVTRTARGDSTAGQREASTVARTAGTADLARARIAASTVRVLPVRAVPRAPAPELRFDRDHVTGDRRAGVTHRAAASNEVGQAPIAGRRLGLIPDPTAPVRGRIDRGSPRDESRAQTSMGC
jgi:hypothetical protein